jgi:hypothetical protein
LATFYRRRRCGWCNVAACALPHATPRRVERGEVLRAGALVRRRQAAAWCRPGAGNTRRGWTPSDGVLAGAAAVRLQVHHRASCCTAGDTPLLPLGPVLVVVWVSFFPLLLSRLLSLFLLFLAL